MTVCLNDLKIAGIAARSDAASCRRLRKAYFRNVIQLICRRKQSVSYGQSIFFKAENFVSFPRIKSKEF